MLCCHFPLRFPPSLLTFHSFPFLPLSTFPPTIFADSKNLPSHRRVPGIGLEFIRQLLARGDQIIAAVRDPFKANELWQLSPSSPRPGAGVIHQCDVMREDSFGISCRAQSNGLNLLTLSLG